MKLLAPRVIDCGMFDSRVKYPQPEGTVSAVRTVPCYELEIITEPRDGCAFIDGRAYRRRTGMLILAKPGAKRYSEMHFRCGYVHFTTEDPALRAQLDTLPDVVYSADPTACLSEFRELLRLTPAESPIDALRFDGAFCRYLAAMIEHMTRDGRRSAGAGIVRYRAALEKSAAWLTEHLGEPVSLSQAAAQANLSPSYYHKLFTALYGVSPGEYLLRRRIEKAKLLLLESDGTLTEIAESCGFSSQSYFGKQFRRAVGVTPARYRSEMLGKLAL
ncbi:MAG: helix-turn-helix transcriptional regulator [Oscillospiraceae bacterium]|nr:helix-turn-helix transcriptional regulator [Oscillospiraceae bacterium]